MDLHEILARLTRHSIFKEWHSKNSEYFLVHAFVLLDEVNKGICQIGFYNHEKERMVTFMVSPTEVQVTQEQEVLKKESTIQKLNPEDVKLTIEDALKISKQCIKENYSAETPLKEFFIIQNTEGQTMFNITLFTQSFHTINIKINATTGKLIKHSKQQLAEFT